MATTDDTQAAPDEATDEEGSAAATPPAAEPGTSSKPMPAPRRDCPNLGDSGFGVVNIKVQGITCDTASAIMRASRGRDTWTARGFKCRMTDEFRQPGYQDAGHEDIRCAHPDGRTLTYRSTYY